MGLVAPLRYVLITDGMLEQMDDRKIEAVFGHEAGHVKRHHILFFLLFAMISGCLMTVVSVWARAPGFTVTQEQWLITAAGAVLLVKWGLVFGWISRRFERQADVFAVRTLAATGMPCAQPCALHAEPDPPARALAGDELCASAAHVFGDTLMQVATLNGIPPEAPSWRHGSIRARERMIHRLAADPAATGRFERFVFWVKVGILLAAAASAAWAGWELQVWTLLGIGRSA
jgi:STE24 endopeptidase